MSNEWLVERFLDAKHDHIAAYAVEMRGLRRNRPEEDPVFLTAVACEADDFLRTLPREYRTAKLRGKLIYDLLRQVRREREH